MQKATITKQNYDGKIGQNRKEPHFYTEYAVLVPDKNTDQTHKYVKEGRFLRSLIIARLYVTNSTHYACVWVHNHPVCISGGGKAGGYGYHRASAALQCALNDAGITLSEAIDGRGEGAMFDALAAVARSLGYRKFHIHTSHA